jgi:hypothetical protein
MIVLTKVMLTETESGFGSAIFGGLFLSIISYFSIANFRFDPDYGSMAFLIVNIILIAFNLKNIIWRFNVGNLLEQQRLKIKTFTEINFPGNKIKSLSTEDLLIWNVHLVDDNNRQGTKIMHINSSGVVCVLANH